MFTARYDGLCSACKETIHEGETLTWLGGEVVHAACEPDAVKDEVPRPTCSECWQVKSVTGDCGCEVD